MCAIMDDVIGWCGFCVTGECVPWCGFTVQINTSLKAPVKVGSWLHVEAVITSVERRKVKVGAKLVGVDVDERGEEVEVVHCEADGLLVLKK